MWWALTRSYEPSSRVRNYCWKNDFRFIREPVSKRLFRSQFDIPPGPNDRRVMNGWMSGLLSLVAPVAGMWGRDSC